MRAIVGSCVAAVVVAGLAAGSASAMPNILVVLTDDQRSDTLSVMPATRANFDVVFGTGVVTTPNCCPSRASILTGEYAHRHGVLTNQDYDVFAAREAESIGPWLQAQGYYTGMIGKYLNKYRLNEPVPVGWDEFHARVWEVDGTWFGDGYTSLKMRHYAANRNEVVTYDASRGIYSTRLFASLAARFIRQAHLPAFNPERKPWALFVWTTAPHTPLIPEERYADAPVPRWNRPPSYQERDMSDKPREIRSKRSSAAHGAIRAGTLRLLMSVDDLVDRTWNAVDDYDERENTWGIFTSDNGFMWGEHWLSSKLVAYRESSEVPFRMAVPGLGRATYPDAVAANIDVAPTLLEIAEAPPRATDGRSLVAAVRATACLCRRSIVIENWTRARYRAIRAPGWTYIAWPSGNRELYRLGRDPYQLANVEANNPRMVARLHARMETIINRGSMSSSS